MSTLTLICLPAFNWLYMMTPYQLIASFNIKFFYILINKDETGR